MNSLRSGRIAFTAFKVTVTRFAGQAADAALRSRETASCLATSDIIDLLRGERDPCSESG